jgi:hypothetical protein
MEEVNGTDECCTAWILTNHFLNENSEPIEFDDHLFLMQPYDDNHPDIIVKKSAQIGWSTLAILKGIHLTAFKKMNTIHSLPTQNVIKDFVIPKVDQLILKNPAISSLVSKDSLQLKQFMDRFIYYRGAFTEREAITISADLLINDEYDRSDQKIMNFYQSRLQASKFRWQWRFSNPSVKGFGVDELFETSDQMYWFVKCSHCTKEQYLEWPENIDIKKEIYICKYCKRELSDNDRRFGRWVAKYPSRKRRGYHISQLIAPWVKAKYIIEKSNDNIEFFYNFVLGLAYTEAEMVVDRQSIIRACRPGKERAVNVCIGVDNGVTKHYVIGTPAGIMGYGKTESWDDIENLFLRHNAIMVIDANPYPNMPKKLMKKYQGRVFINYYSLDSKTADFVEWKTGKDFGVIRDDRTRIIDLVASEINSQTINYIMTPTQLEEYIMHWSNMYRGVETNSAGIAKGVWLTKEGKPDHYAHATVYYRLALERAVAPSGGVSRARSPVKQQTGVIVKDNKIPSQVDIKQVAKESDKKKKDWRGI